MSKKITLLILVLVLGFGVFAKDRLVTKKDILNDLNYYFCMYMVEDPDECTEVALTDYYTLDDDYLNLVFDDKFFKDNGIEDSISTAWWWRDSDGTTYVCIYLQTAILDMSYAEYQECREWLMASFIADALVEVYDLIDYDWVKICGHKPNRNEKYGCLYNLVCNRLGIDL